MGDTGNDEKFMQDLGVKEGKIAELTSEQMIINLKNDVEAYGKALDKAIKDKEHYIKQLDVDKELWSILEQPGVIKKIKPVFIYEENPRYWELQEKKFGFKLDMDKAMAEGQLKQLEDNIKYTTEALEGAKEKVKRFGGKDE